MVGLMKIKVRKVIQKLGGYSQVKLSFVLGNPGQRLVDLTVAPPFSGLRRARILGMGVINFFSRGVKTF